VGKKRFPVSSDFMVVFRDIIKVIYVSLVKLNCVCSCSWTVCHRKREENVKWQNFGWPCCSQVRY